MKLNNIEESLSDLMINGNMSSLKIAGMQLVIYFSAKNQQDISEFFIETDAWVFVEDKDSVIDYSIINDEDFIAYRRKAIVRLYDLTGYDIESVEIVDKRYLRIIINNMVIQVCPKHRLIQESLYQESWYVMTRHISTKETHVLLRFENDELTIIETHPIFMINGVRLD